MTKHSVVFKKQSHSNLSPLNYSGQREPPLFIKIYLRFPVAIATPSTQSTITDVQSVATRKYSVPYDSQYEIPVVVYLLFYLRTHSLTYLLIY